MVELVITGGLAGARMVKDRILVSVPTRLSAVRVTFLTWAVVGVPLITCVLALNESPDGRLLALKVIGPVPVAVTV